jgi:hypothetical protein
MFLVRSLFLKGTQQGRGRMTLRHISPRSIDWVDAMDEGGRGWEKLAPEELMKLRVEAQSSGVGWQQSGEAEEKEEKEEKGEKGEKEDYRWGAPAASR